MSEECVIRPGPKNYRMVTVGDREEGVMVALPEASPFYLSEIQDVKVHLEADRANPFLKGQYERRVKGRLVLMGMEGCSLLFS